MANVKFARGTETQIDSAPQADGTIYISSDTNKIFVDFGSERIELGTYELPMAATDAIGGIKVGAQVDSSFVQENSDAMIPLMVADESNGDELSGMAFLSANVDNFNSDQGILNLNPATSTSLGGVKTDDQLTEMASNVPTSQAVMDFVESSMSSVDEISISSTEPTEPNVKLWIKI